MGEAFGGVTGIAIIIHDYIPDFGVITVWEGDYVNGVCVVGDDRQGCLSYGSWFSIFSPGYQTGVSVFPGSRGWE